MLVRPFCPTLKKELETFVEFYNAILEFCNFMFKGNQSFMNNMKISQMCVFSEVQGKPLLKSNSAKEVLILHVHSSVY